MSFEKPHSRPICHTMRLLFAENCQQRSHTHTHTHNFSCFNSSRTVQYTCKLLIHTAARCTGSKWHTQHQKYNVSNWLRELFSNKRVIHRVEQYTHTHTCQLTLALNYTAVHDYMETTYWPVKCRLHKSAVENIFLYDISSMFVKRNDSIIVLYHRNKHCAVKQVLTKCQHHQRSRHHQRHQYCCCCSPQPKPYFLPDSIVGFLQ